MIGTVIVVWVLGAVSFLFNGITMAAIVFSRSLWKVSSVFIFNIALADSLSGILIAVERSFKLLGKDTRFVASVFGAASMTSLLTTLAVAFHNLILIRIDPFNRRQLATFPRCVAVCLIIWLADVAMYMVTYRGVDSVPFFSKVVIAFLIVIGAFAVTYVAVYATIARSMRNIGLSSDAYAQRMRKNKQIMCTFALIVGTNVICWFFMSFPLLLQFANPEALLLYDSSTGRYGAPFWLSIFYIVAFMAVGTNSILNPIIYWTRLGDFRQLLRNWCRRRGDDENPATLSTVSRNVARDLDKIKTTDTGVETVDHATGDSV
ncbi:adenosine receptor A2a-like [Diadema antillarum]|uniref:adenosine receptor A2a-like n=1 Tax=Diadema antillarum TaxID=105358 RepID=UPI003A8A8813